MSEPISCLKPDPKYFMPADGPTPLLPKPKESKAPAMNLDAAPTSAPPVTIPKTSDPAVGGQSIDVSAWPLKLLESNAKALHAKLAKDPASVTAAEKERLLKIEDELNKRYAKETPPTLGPVVAKDPKVELCKRPVEIKVIEYTGLQHHWLRTSKKEVGIGPHTGGVPGQGGNDGYYGVPTTMNDHTGQGDAVDATCVELKDVDEACVNEKLALGTPKGRWIPPLNDCHTVTAKIVDDCTKPKESPVKGNTP